MTTYYVAATGSDSNNGLTPGTAFLTLTKADSVLVAGDTVLVQPGTYTFGSTLNTLTNGTSLARITWQCNGAYGAVKLVGTMNNLELWIIKGNFNDVIGFDVSGSLVKTGLSNWGHHNRYFHNTVHDCGTGLAVGTAGSGFFSYAGITTTGTNEWAYNTALRCGQGGVGSFNYHGLYLSTTADSAHDNIASNCAGWGFNISGSGFSAGNSMNIYHNLCFYNVYGGFVCQLSADNNTFANNISYNNNVLGSGISGNGFTEQNTPGTHNIYTNNCTFANGFKHYAGVVEAITNPLLADPQFVNYQTDGSGDYHLLSMSPCIDAGATNAISTQDADGNARFRDYGYDIGPYECFGIFSSYDTRILQNAPSRPMAYYRVNDRTGTSAHESSGNGYHGTLSGSVTFAQTGAIYNDTDTSILFAATASLNVPPALNYTTFSAFSLDFWINTGSGWHYIAVTSVGTTTLTYYDGILTVPGISGPIEIDSIFSWAGSYLAADLAKVGIYNYVLSPAEILARAQLGRGFSTGTYNATIAGIPVFIIANSLNFDRSIGKNSQASFNVQSDNNTHFQQDQQVQIYDASNTLVFSGYVTTPKEEKPGFQPSLEHTITCTNQHRLAEKRLVAASYVNKSPGYMVNDIYTNILASEGVTIGLIYDAAALTDLFPGTGLFPSATLYPTESVGIVPEATFVYCTVAQAFDALVTAASANGVPYYWMIDHSKALWFAPYTAVVNNTVIDGTQIDDGHLTGHRPTVTRANPTYRNTQYLIGGVAQTVSQTETRKGDSNTVSWPMSFDLATAPTITVNAVSKAVGIRGIDTGKDWYWQKGSPDISQDSAGTKLVNTDTLSVTYIGQYPTVIVDRNNAQVSYEQSLDGTTGIVEEVESDTTISSIPNGLAKTSALLTRYAAQGAIFEGMTLQTGYAPGQLVTFDMPNFGLYRVQMLIEDISASDQIDGINIWYLIKAVLGPYDQTWVDFFKVLFKQQAPSNSINVGVSQSVVIAASGSVSLSPSVTGSATPFACPVPSLTTFPSLTLFPC